MEVLHRALLLVTLAACLDPSEPGNLVPATVDDDASLPAIDVGGARYHAETFGDPRAPMVMVLHGGPGGDYRSMLPLATLADDGYFVVFWDQRGAGLSQRFDYDALPTDHYLDDLRDVLAHYTAAPGQPVVFLGHSWGAMYATWFIDTYGDLDGRIRGAVLSEPGAFTSAQLDAFLERQGKSIEVLSELLGDILWHQQFLSPSDHARADYLDSQGAMHGMPSEHRDPDLPAPLWRSGAAVRARLLAYGKDDGFDWTRNLGAYQQPVLFLRGELNDAAPLSHQQELAAAYPHAEIVTIPGVGHQVQWERSDAFLAEVRTYFSKVGFGGAR